MPKEKTIDETLFAEMWRAGRGVKAIASAVGMHHGSVAKRAARMGLPQRGLDGLGPRAKQVDRDEFTDMWNAGAPMGQMCATFDLSPASISVRLDLWELPRRPVGGRRKMVAGPSPCSKPIVAPMPAGPVYHHGLSDAIKRAKGSVQRLGKVATSYRVAYRDVLAMAGVTV